MDFEKLKVTDLKKLLKERGLAITGNKSELVSRLQAHESNADVEPETENGADDVVEDEDELLEEGDEVVEEDDVEYVVDDEKAQEKLKEEPKASVPTKITFSETKENIKAEAKPTQAEETEGDKSETEGDESVMSKRAERFGLQSEDAKKLARAQRFGIPVSPPGKTSTTTTLQSKGSAPEVTLEELEKRKKRAERFGTVVSSTLKKTDEAERLLKRKERFGGIASPTSTTSISTADIEEKKRRRLERFGLAK